MLKGKKYLWWPVIALSLVVAALLYVIRLSPKVTTSKDSTPEVTPVQAESSISVDSLKNIAKELGVDANKFNQCLDDGSFVAKIEAESKEGLDLGVAGTPSFFINGIFVVGSLSKIDFESVIDAELKNGSGDKAKLSYTSETLTRTTGVPYGVGFIKGSKNAKIKIMEYTDFECSYCAKVFPTIEALLAKYDGEISLEYRSFPLPFHADAEKAAEAVLCAGEQGKFWEMHDKIFTVMAGN